jgi:hypothetical protein
MNDSRLDRLVPLSGVLAVLAIMLAAAMIGVYDYLPTGERLVEVFSGNPNRLVTSGFLGNFSAFLFFAFASCATVRLRQAEPTGGWLVKFGNAGGVSTAVVLGIGFSALIATGSRAGSSAGLGPIEAVTLYDLCGNMLGQLFGVTMAAFMIGASLIWLRAHILPRWFNWASIVVAVLLLTPGAYIMLLVALLWTAVVSIWIYRSQPSGV